MRSARHLKVGVAGIRSLLCGRDDPHLVHVVLLIALAHEDTLAELGLVWIGRRNHLYIRNRGARGVG